MRHLCDSNMLQVSIGYVVRKIARQMMRTAMHTGAKYNTNTRSASIERCCLDRTLSVIAVCKAVKALVCHHDVHAWSAHL
jgi:hypothetical protein